MSVLECTDLSCGYNDLKVVRNLNLRVETGTVLAVLGPNGAGKSTLMMTLAGLLPRLGGEASVDGKALPSGRPSGARNAGITLVPDDRALFATLTARENLEAARSRISPPAKELLEKFPTLEGRWNLPAGALSGGEQQMVALARGLIQRPRFLLIDEMSMGLAPLVVESLLEAVREIADGSDVAVVLVEQHVRLALEVADNAIVLVHGDVSLDAPAAELRNDMARIESAYIDSAEAPEPSELPTNA